MKQTKQKPKFYRLYLFNIEHRGPQAATKFVTDSDEIQVNFMQIVFPGIE